MTITVNPEICNREFENFGEFVSGVTGQGKCNSGIFSVAFTLTNYMTHTLSYRRQTGVDKALKFVRIEDITTRTKERTHLPCTDPLYNAAP